MIGEKDSSAEINRPMDASALCVAIEDAFSGVALEDGIGLWQAQGIDDYEDDEICEEYRERDEKDDWKAISVETLDRCASSICFFDAKGFRFHLPAFLIADLTVGTAADMEFFLVSTSSSTRDRYKLLSKPQRRVVREFLYYTRSEPDFSPEIDTALSSYWNSDVHVD